MLAEERPASSLAITFFGPFDVRLEGRPLPRLRSQKSQWLLALLALQAGRAVERAWLAGMLWPDSPGDRAAFNLRRNLTDLRQSLGPEAHRLEAPSKQTLRLDLVGAEADLLIFDEAIARGDTPSLKQAVALHRGLLLQGCDEEWVLPEREAREQAFQAALETLAAWATARGDPAAAIHYLRRLVTADPLRDSGQRALMQALAAAGDIAAAAQTYRDFRLRLHQELNATPDAETTALYQQLRAAARARARERESEQERADERASGGVGERGIEATRSMSPGWSSPTRPLAHSPTPPSVPRRLPAPWSTFIGRESECAEIAACLARERLVTLTGPGGVGKTRLALRVAEEFADEMPDGAWFVDLAPLSDPALVPQVVATTLEMPEQADRPLTSTLQEFLRPKQLLLLLDNCEHLLEPCARLVDTLLSGAPHLRILATSRQSLGLPGERVWRVPSLSLPAEGEALRCSGTPRREGGFGVRSSDQPNPKTEHRTPKTLLNYEAVRLFVERGQEAARTFALTDQNAGAVVSLCRRLDGLPLALELASARLAALSVEEIVARLDDRFRLLTGGNRTALPRQQTLWATVDWSCDLLSDPERLLLQRLSVFAGGFTLEAAEAVCADLGFGIWDFGLLPGQIPIQDPNAQRAPEIQNGEVLDLLTRLVDRSLVIVDAREGGTRYRLLETVRQYARERLRESGEAEHAQRRHQTFYLRLAEEAAAHLGSPDHITWMARLDPEQDNLRAALDGSLESALEIALRLTAALAGYWEHGRRLEEGRQRLTEVLEKAGTGRRSPAGAAALEGASALALLQADRRSASALQEECLAIRRELGDQAGMAASLTHFALLAVDREEYATGRALYDESLAIRKALGDQAGIAAVLTGLGHVARRERDYGLARSLHEESLAIRRTLGDQYGIAQCLVGLGIVLHNQEDQQAARAHYEEALAIQRELGDPDIAGTLGELANVACRQGNYAEARRLREESLVLWRAMGARMSVIHSLGALGHVAREQGDYQDARRFYAESILLRQEVRDPFVLAQSLEDFAELAAREQQWARMTRLLAAALALRDLIDKPLLPHDRADYDRLLAGARRALPELEVAAAWEAGHAMSLEQAVAYALTDIPAATAAGSLDPSEPRSALLLSC